MQILLTALLVETDMHLIPPTATVLFATTPLLVVYSAIRPPSAQPVLACSILLETPALLARTSPTASPARLPQPVSRAMPTSISTQEQTSVFPVLLSATASLASTPPHVLPASMVTTSTLLTHALAAN